MSARRVGVATILMMLILAPYALGTQHLVRPGADWEELAPKLQPGDDVLLLPGRHKPARLFGIRGTTEAPIRIRGIDPNDTPIIEAGTFGIRLGRPTDVVIENLIIEGADFHGILVDGGESPPKGYSGHVIDDPGRVTIRSVAVRGTGGRGQRHAIVLRHLRDVRLLDAVVTGWSGSGVEAVACEDLAIVRVDLEGLDGYAQESGIRLRGGTRRATIERCTVRGAALQPICLGGRTPPDEWRAPSGSGEPDEEAWEVADVRVSHTVVEGGLCGISLLHATRIRLEQLTILRPRDATISVRRAHQDERYGTLQACLITGCLIAWEPGDIKRILHLGANVTPPEIDLGENLWWSPGWTPGDDLGPLPGEASLPQLVDVDPKLDAEGRPQAPQAVSFGAFAGR